MPRHGPDKRAFTDAAAPEYADPLPESARQQPVDSADSRLQGFCDVLSLHRTRRRRVQTIGGRATTGALLIQRLAQAVQDTPEQLRPDRDARLLLSRHDGVLDLQTVDLFQWHRKDVTVAETDHLRADAPARAALNLAEIANGRGRPLGLHEQPDQFHHLARPEQRIEFADPRNPILQVQTRRHL